MCSVSAIALPDLMYQAPCGVTPAACQSSSSFLFVSESSARDTYGAPAAAMRLNASTAVVMPSDLGGIRWGTNHDEAVHHEPTLERIDERAIHRVVRAEVQNIEQLGQHPRFHPIRRYVP